MSFGYKNKFMDMIQERTGYIPKMILIRQALEKFRTINRSNNDAHKKVEASTMHTKKQKSTHKTEEYTKNKGTQKKQQKSTHKAKRS